MFKINMEFTQERISDLLVSALEGGSNYWYRLENDEETDTSKPYWERAFAEGIKISDYIGRDGDASKTTTTLVNPESMQRGLELMITKYPRHFAALFGEFDDAETADVFLQLVVLGELVYG